MDKAAEVSTDFDANPCVAVSTDAEKRKQPSSTEDTGCHEGWLKGFEPSILRATINGAQIVSGAQKGVTASDAGRCTTGCTSDVQTANTMSSVPPTGVSSLRKALEAVAQLSPEERNLLVRLMSGE